MAGNKRIFLDAENFYKLEESYVNIDGIWLYPMEFMAIHNGTDLGLQEISLQGVVLEEVAFADLDLLANVGKYTVDPTTNSIILIVSKTPLVEIVPSEYITGMLLNYELKTLEYFSTDSLYTMETYSADDTFLGSTQASSTSVLTSKMLVMDASQDVNSSIGYQYHILRRALQSS
jgi:hypothetical protein